MLQIKHVFILLFLFLSSSISGQETYIIEGDTLQLQREVKGTLSLFYSEGEPMMRYFVQKGDRMLELNQERENGIPKYLLQLEKMTRDADIPIVNVKFELYSLRHFTNLYNAKVQEDYLYNASTKDIKKRLGLFTGISNNSYTENPENILVPVIGVEFELYDPNLAPRHSAFVHLRHSFKRDVFSYTSTQLSLNYRFKFIRLKNLDFHIDAELANLMYSRNEIEITNDSGQITDIRQESGFSFTAPLSFGVGSDIRITDSSFITLGYNDIVSLVLDGNGNFPIDFTVGYKYNL